ncbi:MAG: hypothetical protein OXI05_06720 [Bacteroidota bacterium]|nr:hypothetical protein [Bacteroidota bacterium]MDE2645512.1 hypothetical protein [Bacteroidota bacterium]
MVVSTVVAFLILAGCENIVEVDSLPENSSVSTSPEVPSMPQIKDGMLYFKTKADFDTVADYLIYNQKDYGLDEFEAKLSPFSSLSTGFDELINQSQHSDDDSLEVDRIVEDPVFETLLNRQGMIRIADTIYQVTRDYVYSAHIDHALILGKAGLDMDQSVLRGNQVTLSSTIPLVKYKVDRIVDVQANPGKNMDVMGRGECYVFFSGGKSSDKYRYRMKGSIWINNWGIYRSAGTELESQKKKKRGLFRRWKHHRVSRIEIDGTFSSREEGSTVTHSVPKNWVKYNAEEIRKTFVKDRDKSLVEIEISLTHIIDHTFGDGRVFAGSCNGYREWSAP